MKHELAVMIWNEFISQSLNDGCKFSFFFSDSIFQIFKTEFISQSLNDGCKFSFKDLEDRIGEKINELTCNAYNDSIDELLELQVNNRNNLKL